MKNNVRKIFSIFLIVIMLAVSSMILFACNKEEDSSDQERAQEIASLESTILSGIDSTWTKDLSENEIAAKDNAGSYIVTAGWTKFICSSIDSSYLQTAKIKALNTALASEDGKKVLSKVQENTDLIIPLLRETGFTSNDVAYLVYSLVYNLVDNGGDVINEMSAKLGTVGELAASNNVKAYENIKDLAKFVEAAKASNPNDIVKKEILTAISNAQPSFIALSSFAYNMSINAISEDVYNVLVSEEGALADIKDSEIQTFVNTLLGNISSLKASLTEEQLSYINEALSLIIDNYDKTEITSTLLDKIVEYGKKIYSYVDLIPAACDFVISIGDVIGSTDFINTLRSTVQNYGENSYVNKINVSAVMGRIVFNIMEDYSKAQFDKMIDEILVEDVDYSKVSALLTLDTLLNLGGNGYVHSDIMDDTTYGKLFVLVGSNNNIPENEVPALINALKSDLKAFVNDYYMDSSTVKAAWQTLSSWNTVEEITETEYVNSYKSVADAARISGLFALLTSK